MTDLDPLCGGFVLLSESGLFFNGHELPALTIIDDMSSLWRGYGAIN